MLRALVFVIAVLIAASAQAQYGYHFSSYSQSGNGFRTTGVNYSSPYANYRWQVTIPTYGHCGVNYCVDHGATFGRCGATSYYNSSMSYGYPAGSARTGSVGSFAEPVNAVPVDAPAKVNGRK